MWALLNVNQVRTQVFLHLKIANGHKVTATSKKKKEILLQFLPEAAGEWKLSSSWSHLCGCSARR